MSIKFDGSTNNDHYATGGTNHPQTTSFSFEFPWRFFSWKVGTSGSGFGVIWQNWYEATGGADFVTLLNDASGNLTLVTYSGGSPVDSDTFGPLTLNRNYMFFYAHGPSGTGLFFIDGALAMTINTAAAIAYDDFFFGGGDGQAGDLQFGRLKYWTDKKTSTDALAERDSLTVVNTTNLWDLWPWSSYQATTYTGSINGHVISNLSAGDTFVDDDMVISKVSPPVFGTIAYSTAGGGSVAPTYPAGITAGEKLTLLVGQKPATANGGGATTPSGWALDSSRTGANDGDTGGYTTTLGADTGNVNIYEYTKTAAGTETGTLTVTLSDNDVAWAVLIRWPASSTTWDVAADTGKDTSGGSVSIATSAGISVQAGDVLLGAMCIPTDVSTPTQFSAQAFAQTGVVFTTAMELGEPDSGNGNDIGGFVCYAYATDGSGAGAVTLTATAGGTTTNVRGPGVVLRLRAGGATNYTQSVSGAIASAGALIRQARAVRAGTVTSAGALTKQPRRALAGAISSAGALVKTAQRALTGSVASAGALVKRAQRSLAGSIASAGALVGSKVSIKVLAGTVTSAGALTKRTARSLAGTVASAGALSRSVARALAGSIASAGSLSKRAARALSGGVASSGVVSGAKVALKVLAGTVTSAGALVKQAQLMRAGSVASAGALVKRTQRALTGSVSSAGSLLRRTLKTLAGTIASAGVGAGVKIGGFYTKALTGTVTSAGVLVRAANKNLGGSVTSSGSLVRRTLKGVAGAVAPVGSLAKRIYRALVGAVSSSGHVSGVQPQNVGPQGKGRVSVAAPSERIVGGSKRTRRDSGR